MELTSAAGLDLVVDAHHTTLDRLPCLPTVVDDAGEQLARLGQFLTPQHVDGVLVASMHDGLGLPEGLDVPVVYAGRPSDAAAAYVDIDNRGKISLVPVEDSADAAEPADAATAEG